MMESRKLEITLKSDLCVGSGYSYAGIIDSDVCYDDCGLPYIPAKRLKGCMREAAELIGISEHEIERLFGKGGEHAFNENSEKVLSGLILSNAYIMDYEKIHHELKHMDSELKKYISSQNVLEQFTVMKTQTKIMENGVAEDNSFRFIRAVKHYSPVNKNQELVFIANIDFVGLDDNDIENLEMIVKALRNIGMNRNRGLGSVVCALQPISKPYSGKVDVSEITDDEGTYVLSYCVRNIAPLVLNVDNSYKTEKYISGQSVLGYFASAYLKSKKNTEDDFKELFLKNQVIFSGLYPSEKNKREEEPEIYYPAPSYINCLKKTKKYVNVSKIIPDSKSKCEKEESEDEDSYVSENGNKPRKMKGKFVCEKQDGILVKEVESDIIYHHTKKSKKQDSQDGELLYSFEAVCEQQTFAGTITGKGKYIKLLAHLLQHEKMRFGKSKSVQYGMCVIDGVAKARKMHPESRCYSAGSRIMISLRSDGIFMGENGYTVRCEEVRQLIKDKLHIKEPEDFNTEKLYAEVEVRELVGFNAKWNLKRQAIPVVCAGSSFEFILAEDLVVSEGPLYVGERIGEGYGQLTLVENNGEEFRIFEAKKGEKETVKPVATKEICRKILIHEMKECLANEALKENLCITNSSTLGRITLMLKESIDKYPDKASEAYQNFCARINSIKIKKKKDQIAHIKNKLICEEDILTKEKLKYYKYVQPFFDVYEKMLITEEKKEEEKSKLENEVISLWSDYFIRLLTQEKYRQKEREVKNEKNKNVLSY